MAESPFFLRPELLPVIEATPEQTTWDLPAMRAGGDALLDNPHEPINRLEVTSRGRSFIPDDLRDNAPILVSIHGGGYVAGRAAFDDAKNDELATHFGAIVVSPEYRLAPEFPFPIPVGDCISALAEALERFGYERPIFVLGDSAGAGLAYSMVSRLYGMAAQVPQDKETAAQYVRISSMIRGIVLLEPCIDPSLSTHSSSLFADGPIWTRRAAAGAWSHFFGLAQIQDEVGKESEIPDALLESAFPKPRERMRVIGFPPALVVVNPVDPLRDEGIALATGLVDSGCIAELHMFAGTFHGSLSVPDSVAWNEIRSLISRFMTENS